MNPITAFITGLTTGGLTCLAVQGGLLFGLLALRQEEKDSDVPTWKKFALPISAFLIAKFVAYTILGLGLGWIGSKLQLTPTVRLWMQAIAALVMIITAIKLVFPGFLPWFTLVPPSAARRLVRKQSKSTALVAPAALGFLTILLPCGTTQAMEVAAIATGSAVQAASILGAFVLGTVPLFFIIGVLAKGTALFQRRLSFVAATVVLMVGLSSFNGVLVAIDSPFSYQNYVLAVQELVYGNGETVEAGSSPTAKNVQDVATINVLPNGYAPTSLNVPAGKPVTLTLTTDKNYGCTSVFRIPKVNIEKTLEPTGSTTVTATFPQGDYTYTCAMGMYRGTIHAL